MQSKLINYVYLHIYNCAFGTETALFYVSLIVFPEWVLARIKFRQSLFVSARFKSLDEKGLLKLISRYSFAVSNPRHSANCGASDGGDGFSERDGVRRSLRSLLSSVLDPGPVNEMLSAEN